MLKLSANSWDSRVLSRQQVQLLLEKMKVQSSLMMYSVQGRRRRLETVTIEGGDNTCANIRKTLASFAMKVNFGQKV